MSLFLGPIHYWLYHKVQRQEALTQALLDAFPAEKEAVLAVVDTNCGQAETRSLEEVIDESNIHGWLQNQVSIVESRLASAAAEILKTDKSRLETLEQTAFDFGKTIEIDTANTAQTVFQSLNNVLLDGMPCDHVNMTVEQSENSFCWERSVNLHANFWENAGCDAAVYDAIRGAWIKGMLADTGFAYKQDGERFYIEEV